MIALDWLLLDYLLAWLELELAEDEVDSEPLWVKATEDLDVDILDLATLAEVDYWICFLATSWVLLATYLAVEAALESSLMFLVKEDLEVETWLELEEELLDELDSATFSALMTEVAAAELTILAILPTDLFCLSISFLLSTSVFLAFSIFFITCL